MKGALRFQMAALNSPLTYRTLNPQKKLELSLAGFTPLEKRDLAISGGVLSRHLFYRTLTPQQKLEISLTG